MNTYAHISHFYWAGRVAEAGYGPGSQWLWAPLWCPLDHGIFFVNMGTKCGFIWHKTLFFFLVTIYLHGSPSMCPSWTAAECSENWCKNWKQNNLSCGDVVRAEYDHVQERLCFTKRTKRNTVLLTRATCFLQGQALLLPHWTRWTIPSLSWLTTRFWPAGSPTPAPMPAGYLGKQQCGWEWLSNFWASATWFQDSQEERT